MSYSGEHGAALAPDDIDALAQQARDGDRDALEQLLAEVRPRVLNICRGVLPYSGDAEDACQEAMLNVATKIGSWGGRGRFTTWLHIVAVNSARTTYRRLRNLATPTDFEDGAHDRPDPRTTSVIAGTRLDLLDAMETIERDHPQFVEPLLLRDVYGLPYDEIAALVDAPLGTVKAQIHHGRKLARPLLRGER
ncbi:RNA polymerase subunit sigma-24 [Nocardioides sp. Root122]|uniref:RNA polymerase sigma factor n=1 Tax=Nocardioides TaxID=1839 RepID=UPI000702E889|nr:MULTISPECIES: RNA polymerase sigma factor [Nocardioides]KQV77470.1 RNA polymerase subunit sigma-24 [Nocardioides sp. Root122]MCK9821893.1 RNA polymerase sigma factor [Nocardioides cavernae]